MEDTEEDAEDDQDINDKDTSDNSPTNEEEGGEPQTPLYKKILKRLCPIL